MKDSLVIILFFAAGILCGVFDILPLEKVDGDLAMYALYALIFCVGFSVGNNLYMVKNF